MSNQIKITLTIIIAVIVAYVGYRYMKDLPFFSNSKVIYTYFRGVDGLSGGSPVYISGVKVGTVKDISLAGRDSVKVALNFNNDVKINKGSTAYLQSSLLGNATISIEEGNGSQAIPGGGTIKGKYSGGILGTLKKSGTKLTTEASKSFEKLNNTLAQLQEVVNEKNVRKIHLMLTNLQQSTAQLSLLMKHRRRQMEESITHANRFLANLDTITTQNKGAIDSSMTAFNQSMQHFKTTSAKLDTILAKINNGKGSAGKLVNDSSFYNNLDSLSVNLNRLIENINKNPTKYLKGLKLIDIF